ncbi:MAG: M48 family metalloprotease [Gammaproteobacteria bacterium]|nr:M48 family metalloprotease [Gammaproteobacteria bacterium]MBU1624270.1 M48 family metalloprotease [Gammaproteobacteria bacterium]MBU1980998.1 M48 family metalloprotease [Gammaproteobacteria bacterium]
MSRSLSFLFIGIAALALTGCAQNPVTGQQDFVMMSEAQEINLGRQADADVRKQYKVYPNPALQAYVDRVGQNLATHSHRNNLRYRFTVLDSPEINAFALPGGYVYITRGIMAYLNSEAEMAAVLGHEIGHVTARHGVRQQSASQAANLSIQLASILVPELNNQAFHDVSNLLGGALLSGYGRDHELESDRLGAQYLARTEYDPQAMIRVVGVLKNQELFDAEIAKQEGREPRRYHGTFATHPDNDTRLQQVVGEAGALTVVNPAEKREEYLRQTAGLTFGESVDEGVVRDNRFVHRDLGIAITFPADWSVKNLPTQLLALSPGNDALLQFGIDAKPAGTVVEYARNKLGRNAKIEPIQIAGHTAALGEIDNTLLGVIYDSGRAFLIQGNTKAAQAFPVNREAMEATIRSFRTLSAKERKQIKPLTLHLITANKGDTYATLAQRSPLGRNAEKYLRLINAQYPQGEPIAGQLMKVVE